MDTDFGKAALADPRMYAAESSIGRTILAGSILFRPKNWRRYGAGIMSGCRSISSMEIRCRTID
mgnify:CR=1 FL=1